MKELIFIWAAVISLHGEMPQVAVEEAWRMACTAWEPAAAIEFYRDIGHVDGQPAVILRGTCAVPEEEPQDEPEEEPMQETYDA